MEWLSYVAASVSGVTILLSLTVFLNLVAETLPQVSDAIPLLGRIAALACTTPICLLCSGGDLCSFERFVLLICCDYFCLGFKNILLMLFFKLSYFFSFIMYILYYLWVILQKSPDKKKQIFVNAFYF